MDFLFVFCFVGIFIDVLYIGVLICWGFFIDLVWMSFFEGLEGVVWVCVWVFFSDISFVGGEIDSEVICGLREGVLVIFEMNEYLMVI